MKIALSCKDFSWIQDLSKVIPLLHRTPFSSEIRLNFGKLLKIYSINLIGIYSGYKNFGLVDEGGTGFVKASTTLKMGSWILRHNLVKINENFANIHH